MRGLAIGRYGIGFDEFMQMPPTAFFFAMVEFEKKEVDKEKANWEKTRMLYHATLRPHMKESVSPQELLPFAWEKEQVIDVDAKRKEASEYLKF